MILIFGGGFLAYEGAHKVWEKVSGHDDPEAEATEELAAQGELTPEHEAQTVAGAIRTDFILSAEIMVIALKEVVELRPRREHLDARDRPGRRGRPHHRRSCTAWWRSS